MTSSSPSIELNASWLGPPEQALRLLEQRARQTLLASPPGIGDPARGAGGSPAQTGRVRGDGDLESLPPRDLAAAERAGKPAAVLVGIIPRADGLQVLLTRRAAGLARHASQIAFPGGRCDADDGGPLATALREAQEEVGLAPAFVRPLGYLDAYVTGTGYRISPVVGVIDPRHSLRINPDEVESTFEVPLAFLLDARNHAIHAARWQGGHRRFHALSWQQHYIWGATAGIIRNLHDRIGASDGSCDAARTD